MYRLIWIALFFCTLVFQLADSRAAEKTSDQQPETELLGIGSKAPKLDIEHWYGDESLSTKISFKPDHVYVVEFWATWCGPCVQGMSHLAKLQHKFANQNVTVIGVSDEKPEKVQAFLKRKVKDSKDDEETYAQLTSAYRLASDPDESTHNDYMLAAKQTGIPCAFIVGKTGRIEWVGHPGRMDSILEKVVNDEWDGEEHAKELAANQRFETLIERFYEALEKKDLAAARELIREVEAIPNLPDAKEETQYLLKEIEFTVLKNRLKTHPDAATKKLAERYGSMKGDTRGLFFDSVGLIEDYRNGDLPMTETQFKIMADACEAEIDDAGIDTGIILNVLGNLHQLMGDPEESEAFHRRAIAYDKTQGGGNLKWYQSDLDAMLKAEKGEKTPNEQTANTPSNKPEFSRFGLTMTVPPGLRAKSGGKLELVFSVSIPDGHHIYGSSDDAQPTRIEIESSEEYTVGKATVPTGKLKETIAGPRHYLTGKQQLKQSITISPKARGDIKIVGEMHFLICKEDTCRPAKLPFQVLVSVIVKSPR